METKINFLHMIRIRNRETITDDPPPPFKKRQIGSHLELWHYSCVPVSVFNFTLNRFHVAEPNLGSIRGVFQTVLPCVCVQPRANLCVRQSVGLSTRLPYSNHKRKASLSKVEPFVRTLCSLMKEHYRHSVFEEEQSAALKENIWKYRHPGPACDLRPQKWKADFSF